MTEPAPHTRDTIGTIRRNAGKMPAEQLADELGWSMGRLERVARLHGYDLRYSAQDGDPSPTWLAASRGDKLDPNTRCIHVNVLLYPADVAAIDVVGRSFGIKRSRVISRAVENALARGILANLSHMPAPRRDLTPEAEPEVPREATQPEPTEP